MSNLSDKHMNQVCKRLTNLKHVSVWSSSRLLTGFAFKQMGSLTQLTTMKLDSNKLINDEVRKKNLIINFYFIDMNYFFVAYSTYLSFMY